MIVRATPLFRMDIEDARHHGMRNAGVLWCFFGGREALTAAGAGALASTPAELGRLLSP